MPTNMILKEFLKWRFNDILLKIISNKKNIGTWKMYNPKDILPIKTNQLLLIIQFQITFFEKTVK